MGKYIAGIDLGGTKFATILSSAGGKTIDSCKHETMASKGRSEERRGG